MPRSPQRLPSRRSRSPAACWRMRRWPCSRGNARHAERHARIFHVPEGETSMLAIRAAKMATVAAIALFDSLVAFGNLTDYNTNHAFVEHVMSMDAIVPHATIKYRAITSPALQHAAYAVIIATEVATAVLCWIGAAMLARRLRADATAFNRAKTFAVTGLTLGVL